MNGYDNLATRWVTRATYVVRKRKFFSSSFNAAGKKSFRQSLRLKFSPKMSHQVDNLKSTIIWLWEAFLWSYFFLLPCSQISNDKRSSLAKLDKTIQCMSNRGQSKSGLSKILALTFLHNRSTRFYSTYKDICGCSFKTL